MGVQQFVTFMVVAVEFDGLNGETGKQLFRLESGAVVPRKDDMYDIDGTFHNVTLFKHCGKRAATPKHCQIEIRVSKMDFAALRRDHSWCDTVYEAFQRGVAA